ncbi:hypothetical protein MTO96_028910 [Rhipicephalus appendiculatus]
MHLKLQEFGIMYLPHSSFSHRCYCVRYFPALLGVYNNFEVMAAKIVVAGFVVENFEETFSLELSSTSFYVQHAGICMGSICSTLLVSLGHSSLTHCLPDFEDSICHWKNKTAFYCSWPANLTSSRFEAVVTI